MTAAPRVGGLAPAATRTSLRALLLAWRDGRVGAAEVKEYAEGARGSAADPVARELIADLDLLEVHLLTPEDVPALLAALDEGDPGAAIATWSRHRAAIDLDARCRTLRKDPLYRPLCR